MTNDAETEYFQKCRIGNLSENKPINIVFIDCVDISNFFELTSVVFNALIVEIDSVSLIFGLISRIVDTLCLGLVAKITVAVVVVVLISCIRVDRIDVVAKNAEFYITFLTL